MKNKFYKLLSIFVAVVLIVTCCSIAFTVSVGASTATYYVSASRSDDTTDGTNPETPFKTISGALKKAIADANEGGYNTPENTVCLKAMGNSGSSLVAWGAITLPAYGFTLKLTSHFPESVTTRSRIGDGGNVAFSGPTVIENVDLNFNSDKAMRFCGNDVKIASNLDVYGRPSLTLVLGVNGDSSELYVTKSQEVILEKHFVKIALGNFYNYAEYNADLNLTYNQSSGTPTFYFGSFSNSKTKYNSNVNIDLKNATSITFNKNNGAYEFGPNAAVQVINSTGKTIPMLTLI